MEIANKILNSESIKPNKKIMFAGKEYLLNEETGQLEIIEKKVVADVTPLSVTVNEDS